MAVLRVFSVKGFSGVSMQKGLIKYRDGYKYQLAEDYSIQVPVHAAEPVSSSLLALGTDGTLVIRRGYAWDGPSGLTIDTTSAMRGSLVHDALYQLMREEKIGLSNRPIADELLYQICVDDGMWKWRAWIWRRAVKTLAAFAALPENDKKIITAP